VGIDKQSYGKKECSYKFIYDRENENIGDYETWGNARKIAEIPSYMYPQIRDKECYVFNNLELYQSFN